MFRLVTLDHLVLRVVDLKRMLHFYCDALGCTIEKRQEGIGLIQLRAGKTGASEPEKRAEKKPRQVHAPPGGPFSSTTFPSGSVT